MMADRSFYLARNGVTHFEQLTLCRVYCHPLFKPFRLSFLDQICNIFFARQGTLERAQY